MIGNRPGAPEFHSHFAEHLGSCVYGGIWVGPKSPIENVEGFRKAAVDYLKELGVPYCAGPAAATRTIYHWREGIGPAAKRPKRVNIWWGNYVEDNSFGTHEFIRFCRLIGAEPYFAANVGSGSPREYARLDRVLQLPLRQRACRRALRQRLARAIPREVLGRGQRGMGCGGNYRPDGAGAEFPATPVTRARSAALSHT